jgi:hypothetical protein
LCICPFKYFAHFSIGVIVFFRSGFCKIFIFVQHILIVQSNEFHYDISLHIHSVINVVSFLIHVYFKYCLIYCDMTCFHLNTTCE